MDNWTFPGFSRSIYSTGFGQNGDTKTATDCPDQNGDKLKRRQAKTVTGTVC